MADESGVPVVPVEPNVNADAIDEMMTWVEGNIPAEPVVPTTPVVPVAPEPVVTPVVPEPVVPEPVVPVVPVAPVTPEPVIPPVQTSQDQIAALQAEILRLAGMINTGGAPIVYPPQAAPTAVAPVAPVVPVTTPVAPVVPEAAVPTLFADLLTPKEYLTKEQLDQVVDKPELINQAIHQSRTEMVESFASALPTLINMAVNRQLTISKAVTSFYEQNKDLLPHSAYVQFVLGEQERLNPTKPYSEIFQITADESRKRLGLQKPQSTTSTEVVTPGGQATIPGPAFAGTKGGTSTPIAPKGGSQEWFDPAAQEMLDGVRPSGM
jgi:hypothetical protein